MFNPGCQPDLSIIPKGEGHLTNSTSHQSDALFSVLEAAAAGPHMTVCASHLVNWLT